MSGCQLLIPRICAVFGVRFHEGDAFVVEIEGDSVSMLVLFLC